MTTDTVDFKHLPYLRTSERATFAQCPQAWYWGYVEGLTPVEEKKVAADFGTLFHVAMAEYYGLPGTVRGPHPAETWDKLAKDQMVYIKTFILQDDDLVATWEDFHQLGIVLAEAYVERYQGDPHWSILDAERRFSVSIPDIRVPAQIRDGRRGFQPICNLVGTFDLCYRDLNDGYVKMVDHKTVGRIWTKHLTLDPQASTYIAVASKALRDQKLIGPQEIVRGMEYNFIKRAKLDERVRDEKGQVRNIPIKKHYEEAFRNADIMPIDFKKMKIVDMQEWASDNLPCVTIYGDVAANQSTDNFSRTFVPRTQRERNNTIIRISQESQVMQRMVAGEIPVLKHFTKDCTFCKFYDLCELDEAGENTDYFKETVFKQHDPYFDHRPAAVNSKKVTDAQV